MSSTSTPYNTYTKLMLQRVAVWDACATIHGVPPSSRAHRMEPLAAGAATRSSW